MPSAISCTLEGGSMSWRPAMTRLRARIKGADHGGRGPPMLVRVLGMGPAEPGIAKHFGELLSSGFTIGEEVGNHTSV
jgi:hypothetical protein